MSEDEKMDALLRQMTAEEYNRPPQIVPREQMWEMVVQGLGNGSAGNLEQGTGNRDVLPLRSRVPRWVYFAVAAVLLLAVGIQVGRRLGPANDQQARSDQVPPKSLGDPVRPSDSTIAAVTPPNGRSDNNGTRPKPASGPERNQVDPNAPDDIRANAYTVVAALHLTEAEAMLTAFKGDLSQGRMDAEIASWGKDLLSNTRLLLDSPAARDPVRRKLFQDLELVLVQIVQLSPKSSARDRDFIKGAMSDDQVLTRLRTAIPVKGT